MKPFKVRNLPGGMDLQLKWGSGNKVSETEMPPDTGARYS